MQLYVNPYRKTKIRQCPDCKGRNSAERGGNTGCFHCEWCGWTECVDLNPEITEEATAN